MEYFSSFPKIERNGQTVKDITVRLDFLQRVKDNASIFQFIQIQSGERPEDIAYKYYGDASLYWIVLFMNDIVDPYNGWLLTDSQLYKYCIDKYTNIYGVHHYETTSGSELGEGIIVDSTATFKTAISNLSYEQTQNELRRKIKILKTGYLQQVLSEYKIQLNK